MRHLMLLACAAMLLCVGCDGSDPAPIPPDEPGAPALAAYDLAGTWNRSTDVACAGTIDQTQFQALGLMQDHYYSADWMAIEQNGAELVLDVEGYVPLSYTLEGDLILPELVSGWDIAAAVPSPYLSGEFERSGKVLEDGGVIEIRELYESGGHTLACTHEWEFAGDVQPPGA